MAIVETPRHLGRESVWVVAMTLLGAGLRLKGLGALGLDHFDAGIYAQAATWILSEGGLRAIDPGLIPYAPPGYPVLVGLAYAALGPSGTSAILVSILAGVLTIPVIAWLSSCVFGRGAGAATAALIALAGPHVVFSRMGLTDATFLLMWSMAMVAGVHFLDRPGGWRAARLGIAVGLAQLVKYNGWMAGAIVLIAVGAGVLRPGDGRRVAPRAFAFVLLAAGVAALVYLPWIIFVERTTGYAGLLEHHRSYVDGLAGWWPNWRQQVAQARAMEGLFAPGVTWAGLSVALAWVGAAIGQGRSPRSWGPLRSLGPLVVLLLAAASLASPANLSWWSALAWTPALLIDRRPSTRLVGSWFLVMSASTPLYHPYARLWLPTIAASWVAGGGLIAAVLTWFRSESKADETSPGHPSRRSNQAPITALVALALAALGPSLLPSQVRLFPNLLGPSDGLRTMADTLRSASPRKAGSPAMLHVFARPALRFYLLADSPGPLRIHPDLASLGSTVPRPGDLAVLDAGQGVTQDKASMIVGESSWRQRTIVVLPTSIPTVLDVRPDCVYDPSARHLGHSIPTPGTPRAIAVRSDPTCTFWIFDAP